MLSKLDSVWVKNFVEITLLIFVHKYKFIINFENIYPKSNMRGTDCVGVASFLLIYDNYDDIKIVEISI